MCDDCAVYSRDGLIICRTCQKKPQLSVAIAPDPVEDEGEIPLREVVSAPPTRGIANRSALYCALHPAVEAVHRCAECKSPICATCDFAFPGGIHLCPPCATNPKQKLTPGRRNKIMWSIGIGAACLIGSLGMIVLVRTVGADREVLQMTGCMIMIFLLVSVIGLVLGLTSFSRKTFNPAYIWVGVILNGLVVLLWSLLMVVGLMRR